jgi:surface protein
MRTLFASAKAFNQPLHKWNVGKVTDMSFVFNNAQAFNQNVGLTVVSPIPKMSMEMTALSPELLYCIFSDQ